MSLARYAALRMVIAIPVIVLLLTITFLITHVLPANPAALAAGPFPTAEAIAAKEAELGLDKPLPAQLAAYFGDLVQGDLGNSLVTGESVLSEIVDRLPATLELITLGMLLGALLGVGVAILSAERERGPFAFLARLYGGLGASVPDFFLGILLILGFYTALQIAPAPLGQAGPTAPEIPSPTNAYLLDAILAGNASAIGTALSHLALPVLTLALAYSAGIYRVARAAIEDARRARHVDYVILMGGSRKLMWRYVLETAAPPVLTVTGIIYGLLLGGAVIVETIFSWGGIGQYAVTAINNNDFLAIQGFVLVAGVFSILVYLAVDLLHAVVDPRVRSAHKR